MGVQIGTPADSGFDDPLGMLKDCHRRIEHFLGILLLVVERARGRKLTQEEAAAVEAAITYFQTGGHRHTADEEESLFPRLLATGRFAELERLAHDHDEAEELHKAVEELYQAWISEGSLEEGAFRRLSVAINRLRNLYQEHIGIEDNVVFPRAAEVLDGNDIQAIGEEFRARRG